MSEHRVPGGGESEASLGIDTAMLLLGFIGRAVRRRWFLALACLLATVALAVAATLVLPRTYRVDTRILTHPSYLIPNLTGTRSAVPVEAQRMTRGAIELIKSRETRVGIIKELNLIERWRETRSPIGKLLDSVRIGLLGEPPPEEMLEAMLNTLDNKLWVEVDGEVLIISALWHDPQTALDIVKSAQAQFLAMRRDREQDEIKETIALLEGNVKAERPALEKAARELEQVAKRARRSSQRVIVSSPGPSPEPRGGAGGGDQDLERQLNEKRAQVERIEGDYRRRVQSARARLDELRTSLGPRHPDVQAALRELEAQSRPPDELSGLKAEVAQLGRQASHGASRGDPSPRIPEVVEQLLPTANQGVDPELERQLHSYRQVETSFNDLVDRLEAARLELEAATVAFDYRYVVTLPPVLPRKPVKPQAVKILVSAVAVGIFLGLFFAILADLRTGRIIEPWQVDKIIGVRVLGELEEP